MKTLILALAMIFVGCYSAEPEPAPSCADVQRHVLDLGCVDDAWVGVFEALFVEQCEAREEQDLGAEQRTCFVAAGDCEALSACVQP